MCRYVYTSTCYVHVCVISLSLSLSLSRDRFALLILLHRVELELAEGNQELLDPVFLAGAGTVFSVCLLSTECDQETLSIIWTVTISCGIVMFRDVI